MWRLNCSCVCESSREGGKDSEAMIIFNSLRSLVEVEFSFSASCGMSNEGSTVAHLNWRCLQPCCCFFIALCFCFFFWRTEFQIKFNVLPQVHKEKKPFTDWSNITGSVPCMMSLSPLTVHKPPQVCHLSPWKQNGLQFTNSEQITDRCLVLSVLESNTQRHSQTKG